jgi:hypothetical protein
LKGVAGALPHHVGPRQSVQFVVNQGHEPVGGPRLAFSPCPQ